MCDYNLMFHNFCRQVDEMFGARGLVPPAPQDSATFMAQEAMEVVDMLLRQKSYVRNNPKPYSFEELEKEMAQTFMMWIMTAKVTGMNPFKAFDELYKDYVIHHDH